MKDIGEKQIYIERMRGEDIEEIMAIEGVSFSSPWTRNMFLWELRDDSPSHFLVAKVDESIVGYGGFCTALDEAHISSLAVHPSFRRRKIGKRLLTAILDLAKSEGIKEVALEVRAGNVPAQNLYAKFGFKVVGRHQRYYQDTREDALLMSLKL